MSNSPLSTEDTKKGSTWSKTWGKVKSGWRGSKASKSPDLKISEDELPNLQLHVVQQDTTAPDVTTVPEVMNAPSQEIPSDIAPDIVINDPHTPAAPISNPNQQFVAEGGVKKGQNRHGRGQAEARTHKKFRNQPAGHDRKNTPSRQNPTIAFPLKKGAELPNTSQEKKGMSTFLTSVLAGGVVLTLYFGAARVYKWITTRSDGKKKEHTPRRFNPADADNQVEVKYDM